MTRLEFYYCLHDNTKSWCSTEITTQTGNTIQIQNRKTLKEDLAAQIKAFVLAGKNIKC